MDRAPWRYSDTLSRAHSRPRRCPPVRYPGGRYPSRFQDQAAQQHSTADDVLLSVTQVGLGPLMSRMPLRRLTKSGPLMAWKRCTSSGAWGRNSEKEGGGGTRKDKDRPWDGQGAAVQGVFPVLHGGQEILQPAPGDPAQLGVKLVEEDQGISPSS